MNLFSQIIVCFSHLFSKQIFQSYLQTFFVVEDGCWCGIQINIVIFFKLVNLKYKTLLSMQEKVLKIESSAKVTLEIVEKMVSFSLLLFMNGLGFLF